VEDPFAQLRAQQKRRSGGARIERETVAHALAELDSYAAHLRSSGVTDHPLFKGEPRSA
jgi:hypothetical protein